MTITRKTGWVGIIMLLIILAVIWFSFQGDGNTDFRSSEVTVKEGLHKHGPDTTHPEEKKRKIKYWVAPMDPTYISDKPGKSPMGMDLVPVYEGEDEVSVEGAVRIDPVTVQNMGIRTAIVSRGPLHVSIRTIGNVTYNEELVKHIHTKISGWVEKLFVTTTGEKIGKDQRILSIYSPELVATEEEYLQAIAYREKVAGSNLEDVVKGADTLLESTRKRLLLMDIDPEQIRLLEEQGKVQREMTLHSPTSGIVIKKHVFEGMKVNPGMELYTIADLSRVWVIASVYEYELPFLKVGQETTMSLPYEPGTVYRGHVAFIYPYLSPKTRTVQVRMEFDNPDLKLKPDMFADVLISTDPGGDVLLIPSEAVIRTGTRNVVITSLGEGKFLPKEVTLGPEGEDMFQVISGLDEGETVVTSGQFLIDSESRLKEAINKMIDAKKKTPAHDMEDMHKADISMTKEQKSMMSELIDIYMAIHGALVSESAPGVAEEAAGMADIITRIKASDPDGILKDMTGPAEKSLKGLLSGDLRKARDSFRTLNKSVIMFTKGPGRDQSISSGIKIFYCPMEDEHWIQLSADIQNPYMDKDMLMCGVEVEY